MDGWKTSFLLGWPIFRCYVGCREGMFVKGLFHGPLGDVNDGPPLNDTTYLLLLLLKNTWLSL